MCSRADLEEILRKVYEKMRSVFDEKLKQVILYGSHARGDHDEDSDIDIMIIVDIEKHELSTYRDAVWDFAEDIAGQYGYKFIISLKLQDDDTFSAWRDVLPYYKNVLREGIVING
jgi:predicted nucleotidyltransferase